MVHTAVCVVVESARAVHPVNATQVVPFDEDWKLTVPVAPDVTVAVMVSDVPKTWGDAGVTLESVVVLAPRTM